mgnify:CR=1 FL=1
MGANTLKKVPERVIKALRVMEVLKEYELLGGFERNFNWLMEHLLPPSENIKGCECIFADTAFFENGEAKVIVKMDKDYCLTSTKNPAKLISRNVSKEFYQTVRERKRNYIGIFQMKYGANIL